LHDSDGSRFCSLVSDGSALRSDEEGTPFRVAQQVLEGEEKDGWMPVTSLKRRSRAEAVADFWCEIGYPMPASRSWERS
jgi:hypothetical protein